MKSIIAFIINKTVQKELGIKFLIFPTEIQSYVENIMLSLPRNNGKYVDNRDYILDLIELPEEITK